MSSDHKVSCGKAFSPFSTVVNMLDRIIYIERTDVTTPYVHIKPVEGDNQQTGYNFVTTERSYLKIN